MLMTWMNMSSVVHRIRQLLHDISMAVGGNSCMSCGGRLLSNERYVCTPCIGRWPRPSLGNDHRDNVFVRRFWGPFAAEGGAAVFIYYPGGDMTKVVHTMKYGRRPNLCRFMGRAMAGSDIVRQLLGDADCLVPVPITDARRYQRGYNQSELLCEGIAAVTGHQIVTTAIRRIHFSESQTAMSRSQRMDNIRGSFVLGDASVIEHRHVVLVDDIVTSGATILECMSVLRSVPGIKVSVLALAWTAGHW